MKKEEKSAAFAVIETGGKQYMVSAGDILDVELLGGDLSEGDAVTFDKVLLKETGTDTIVGAPYIDGATVSAKFLKESKGPKITIIRYKSKSNRDRKLGHRQHYAHVEITSI